MRIPNIPTNNNPKLFDALVQDLRSRLTSALTWLDYAFPQVQRITVDKDGRQYTYPAVYVGGDEYFDMLPNDQYGNFSFFELDTQIGVVGERVNGWMSRDYNLIFWFDVNSIYPSTTLRKVEDVRDEVFKKLNTMYSVYGSVTIDTIEDNVADIFGRYSIEEVQQQFLMHPYGAMKFSGTMKVPIQC